MSEKKEATMLLYFLQEINWIQKNQGKFKIKINDNLYFFYSLQ